MELKEKVVVVTGSTRGIGRAIAEACGKAGAKVVICSRKESAVNETLEAFKQQDFQVSGIAADVSNYGDLEQLLEHAIEKWGRVDVWINNAGLSGGWRYLQDLSEDEIHDIVAVNLTGTLLACRLVIPYFIEHDGGILINMGGKGGGGKASAYTTTYASTKAAITSLTKSLASEYKQHPISIHSVIPGMVATDFYKDLKVSPGLDNNIKNLPYIMNAFGVPLDVVAQFFVKLAAQQPGKVTGKSYSLVKGWRRLRGIGLMMKYGMSGKLKQ